MPQLLYPRERIPATHWMRGWLDLRANRDTLKTWNVFPFPELIHIPLSSILQPSHFSNSAITAPVIEQTHKDIIHGQSIDRRTPSTGCKWLTKIKIPGITQTICGQNIIAKYEWTSPAVSPTRHSNRKNNRWIMVWFLKWARNFSLFQNVQIDSGAHPAFFQWLSGSAYSEVKRTRREADPPPPSGAKVQNEWSYAFIDCTRGSW